MLRCTESPPEAQRVPTSYKVAVLAERTLRKVSAESQVATRFAFDVQSEHEGLLLELHVMVEARLTGKPPTWWTSLMVGYVVKRRLETIGRTQQQ